MRVRRHLIVPLPLRVAVQAGWHGCDRHVLSLLGCAGVAGALARGWVAMM